MATTGQPSYASTERHSLQGEAVSFDAYGEIIVLARAAVSRSQFMGQVLRCIALYYASPYAALHIRYASQVVQDDCHTGPTDPNFWKPSLQPFLTESLAELRCRAKLLKAKTGTSKVAFLSAPVFDPSGPAIGAIALVIAPIQEDQVMPCLARLEALVRLASFSAEFIGSAAGTEATGVGANQALARAAHCDTTEELAFAITNELRNKLGCEQVALGLVSRRRVRVTSISGLDEVRKQSPGVVSLRLAMEECLDAGTPIVYPQNGGWSLDGITRRYDLHRQWHSAAKGAAVASIPLKVTGQTVAILSLRSRPDRPFSPDWIDEIRAKVEPFAPALMLTQRANRRLARHLVDAGGAAVDALTTPGRLTAKIAAAATGALALWFCVGSMDYELAVPCVVTPAEVRHITAPYDGIVASAVVVDGDRVFAGEILCELDRRDLDQQRVQLSAELTVAERTVDRARADESPVEVQLALANRQLAQARLDIIDQRIRQATAQAPFDGVIVAGDLRKRIGGVVTRGEPLFEVAPLDRWTLQLEVPEALSADLASGLVGAFASYARPEDVREFRVARVLAAAEVRGNRNVYIAEADIDAENDWMRPGMDGIAKIRIGTRPVWWITLHRAIDYLRLNFWL